VIYKIDFSLQTHFFVEDKNNIFLLKNKIYWWIFNRFWFAK